MLSAGAHIPDGNKILIFIEYLSLAVIGLSLLSSLYLIPKANRTFLSFSKAFVLLGAMAALGGCSSWMQKFHGEKKTIRNESGLSLEVPSDWAISVLPNGRVDLFAMDWAGTKSIGVTNAGNAESACEWRGSS